MMNLTYGEIASEIMKYDDIVIFPHVHMDGDALGSSSALCMALRKLGKRAVVLAGEDTPDNLDFLEFGCVARELPAACSPSGSSDECGTVIAAPGLALMVDCGNLSRIVGREAAFNSAPVKACIDHHGVNSSDIEFDFQRIEPDSAAAGEMIYYVIKELGADIDIRIANALYAAISTDTGNFSYSNTTARTHRITEAFFDLPEFNPKAVTSLIYERVSFNTLKLEGAMVRGISLYCGGKLGVGRVTRAMLEDSGARMSDTDGFVNKVLGINGVEAACLLKESDEGTVRVSLRAKSSVNVAAVAARHGGGGHISAAGCTFHTDMDTAEKELAADFAEVFTI